MAILDMFKVELLVNGEPLPEFEDNEEEADAAKDTDVPTVVRYVQALSDQEFEIKSSFERYTGETTANAFCVDIYFDGKYCKGAVVQKSRLLRKDYSFTDSSVPVGKGREWKQKNFKFAKLVTSE